MNMDKYKYYDNIKKTLTNEEFEVKHYREIDYGLQFEIVKDNKKSLIRIYESKKGIRMDLSQIKDKYVLNQIIDILEKQNITVNNKEKILHNGAEEIFNESTNDFSTEFISKDPVELIGTDESGKGDYFGPLVIAGVYVDAETSLSLMDLGATDSKKLSDAKIRKIAAYIQEVCPHSILVINNPIYNEQYSKLKNLNKLLAQGHAQVIEDLLGKVQCNHVLSDQFGEPDLIKNALMEKGKKINLYQRPRAEENIAVAAASILARNEFINHIEMMEEKYNQIFPKGASQATVETAKNFLQKYGIEELKNVAKIHFKITEEINK